jgi:CHASE2 domain-containing sensor protein/signal transduction histidine kinase
MIGSQRRWHVATALVVALAALAGAHGLRAMDRLIDDEYARASPLRPVKDVAILAIDDASIARFGRWPWPRPLQAAMLDKLGACRARAVGVDVLYSEADAAAPDNDARLAQAVRAGARVILPMMALVDGRHQPDLLMPVPPISTAAAGLGHIHVALDDDGLLRRVFLREGYDDLWWDHFALAMARAAHAAPASLPGHRRPSDASPAVGTWQRDHEVVIRYAGPPGTVSRVPVAQLLDEPGCPAPLQGRFVLVGLTASGMADAFATPLAGDAATMPGVEVHANVLQSLLDDRWIHPLQGWQNALASALATLLACILLGRVGNRGALLLVLATPPLLLASAWLVREAAGIQAAPASAVLAVLLAYPVRTWCRLQSVLDGLHREIERIRSQHDILPPSTSPPAADEADGRLRALLQATRELSQLQHLVRENLDGLPDATIVCNAGGTVLYANDAACRFLGPEATRATWRGRSLHGVLSGRIPPEALRTLAGACGDPQPLALEVVDTLGRTLWIKAAARQANAAHAQPLCVASLVDVTPLREAERQRDEAMRFISHDIRAPLAAALTMLDGMAPDPRAWQRVRAYVTRALGLADGIMQLARAESAAPRPEPLDAWDLLMEAADFVWEPARERSVAIEVGLPQCLCYCLADREMLLRALINLIDNAVKYSPAGSTVTCSARPVNEMVRISVRDQGPGVPEDLQPRLFQRYGTLDAGRGIGLGLAFVKAVATRAGGGVGLYSLPGRGAEFYIELPACEEAKEAAYETCTPD